MKAHLEKLSLTVDAYDIARSPTLARLVDMVADADGDCDYEEDDPTEDDDPAEDAGLKTLYL